MKLNIKSVSKYAHVNIKPLHVMKLEIMVKLSVYKYTEISHIISRVFDHNTEREIDYFRSTYLEK